MNRKGRRIEQRCWTCVHGAPKKDDPCPWSTRFKPVPGWTAWPSQLRASGNFQAVDSYAIADCPLYKEG